MISRVRGTLLRRDTELVEVLTAGGLAYEVSIPLPVFERLPLEGEDVELFTHQVVREDDLALYGFLEERERRLFRKLIAASGVGPRLALAMLSSLSPARIVRAIADRELGVLVQVPGVGKKTAERIVLELADRLDELEVAAAAGDGKPAPEEAVAALVALGYSGPRARQAVRKAAEEEEDGLDGAALVKAALRHATG